MHIYYTAAAKSVVVFELSFLVWRLNRVKSILSRENNEKNYDNKLMTCILGQSDAAEYDN